MEFFDDLSVPVKFLLAFVVALAVLGVGGYLMRRFSGGNLAALSPRGRQPRLAVINAARVDGSRRLVLVRRDNVEHLLLIGGPTDVVIEPNIDRTGAAATTPAPVRDAKAGPPPEPPPRQTLSLEGSGLPPGVEPPPPSPVREMTREAMLHPPPVPIERQRLESLIEDTGAPPPLPTPPLHAGPTFYPLPVRPSFELAAHAPPVPSPFEPVFQIPPAPEPKRMPAPRPPQRAAQDEESNLAEMAQRLQAARGVRSNRLSQCRGRRPPGPASPQRRPRCRLLPTTRLPCASSLRRRPLPASPRRT